MDQKLLGNIYSVQLNCYWNRDDRYYFKDGVKHGWHGNKELDGGTLFTQFSHFVDLLYWLFGDLCFQLHCECETCDGWCQTDGKISPQ